MYLWNGLTYWLANLIADNWKNALNMEFPLKRKKYLERKTKTVAIKWHRLTGMPCPMVLLFARASHPLRERQRII